MIYSDGELKRWWANKSETERVEILTNMLDKSHKKDFPMSLAKQMEEGKAFSAKQLTYIRVWDRD